MKYKEMTKEQLLSEIKNLSIRLKRLEASETEHERIEETLRKSEQQYRVLVQNATEGIVVAQDGKVVFVNSKVLEFTDLSYHEVSSRPFVEFIHPDDRAILIERHQRRLKGENPPHRYPIRFVDKEGNIRWVEINTVLVSWDDKPATLSFFNDITEKKQAEDALVREQERLSIILDCNPLATMVIDREHQVVLWNRAREILTGVPREMMLGKPLELKMICNGRYKPALADLVLDMDREAMVAYYGDNNLCPCSSIPDAFEATEELVVGDVTRTICFTAACIRDSRGEVIGAIETAQDITEREQLQKQVHNTQKMQAVGTMAAGIAHEFNNILMTIQGYAELVSLQADNSTTIAECMGHIVKGCRRAAELTKKMLTFSRVASGTKVPVNVNQVLDNVLLLLKKDLPSQIELECELQKELPLVMGEFSQLEQLLFHVGMNACDAVRDSGKIRFVAHMADLNELRYGMYPWAKAGQYIELIVEDSGQGMPAEVLDHVFEPFYTTKDPGKGTGLGLSIAYSIVKGHGGYILAESKLGSGSRFRIHLPAMKSEAAAS